MNRMQSVFLWSRNIPRRVAVLALFGIVLLAVGPLIVSAQNGSGAITLRGTLSPIQPAVEVLVRVTPGVQVTLSATSRDFDPVLSLYDAVGQLIAFSDDNETALELSSPDDAALILIPVVSDIVVVRLASGDWAQGGDYALTLEGVQIIEEIPYSIVQDVSGNLIEGVLAPVPGREAALAYGFRAKAGEPVTLRLGSHYFDSVLQLFSEDGALLAENDDHDPDIPLPTRTDSAVQYTPRGDGVLVAVVRAFEGEGTGRFTLSIQGATLGLQSETVVTAGASMQDACSGTLGRVRRVSSSFGADFGPDRLIDSDLESGWSSRADDLAPFIIFEVSGREPLLIDSVLLDGYASSPGYQDDSIRAFEVSVSADLADPAQFETVLEAVAPQENRMNVYEFSPVEARYVRLRPLTNYGGSYFQASEFTICRATGQDAEGLSGDPPYFVRGQLRADEPYQEYRLYTLENADLTVTVESDMFNTVLETYDGAGRLIADNDDHGTGFDLAHLQDSALHLKFSEPGMLVARVRSFVGGGAFSMTIDGTGIQLTPPEAPSLPPCNDVSSAAAGGSILRASSDFGGRWLTSYLIDGSDETGWASAPGEVSAREEYVMLDLAGGLRRISGFRINPAATGGDGSAYNTSRFAVLVSNTTQEPEAFTEVFSTLLTERYRHTLAFELPRPVRARYVMLQTRDSFGGHWHEVAEFTVCAAG